VEEKFQQLKTRLGEIQDLRNAAALLGWDQQTYMPHRGSAARAEQLATLNRLAHEMFTADALGQMLADLQAWAAGLPYDSDEASLVRVTKRDYDKARRVPPDLVAEFARVTTLAHAAWVEARSKADFTIFAPHLEKIVALNVRLAQALGYQDRLYDALLDRFEPEMKTRQVEATFATLKAGLIPLVEAIASRADRVNDAILHQPGDEAAQWQVTLDALKAIGYDFEAGRQDKSPHPFTTSFSINDVRLTNRFDPNYFPASLFGALHEGGHGLYEQGFGLSLERTPLANGASLGFHESQSRLWENLVGRSREFCHYFLPRLQAAFPHALAGVDVEHFYRAINRVRPSFIRVEADEVTYNLHIIIRFELENDLLEGKLRVADLPAAWNARMQSYLGITPPDDALGCLQDIHWSGGDMGYFPTYTLGNIIAVQLFEQAQTTIKDLPAQIAAGQFAPLLAWMRENVHRHGSKFTPDELLRRITGRSLDPQPYLRYLNVKYGEIYGL